MIRLKINDSGSLGWFITWRRLLRINKYGYDIWDIEFFFHNNNGPAIVSSYLAEWFINGRHHKLDGPAVEWNSGTKEWWINGVEYDTEFEYWFAVQNYDKT